jgi:hypothetical protein
MRYNIYDNTTFQTKRPSRPAPHARSTCATSTATSKTFDMFHFAPGGQLLKHEMRLCVPCIKSTTDLGAAAVVTCEATVGLG